MRKATVRKGARKWSVLVKDPEDSSVLDVKIAAWVDTHAEALFLAQLLADPHEYIRAAQERAWHGGKSVGRIQEYFTIPGPISPYREED